jgi:hypothetical protein
MRYVLIPLSALALLAGCASSQQAGVEPVASPVIVTESMSATVPPAVVSAVPAETTNQAPVLAVADASPVNTVPSLVQPQALDPFQCMMSWTKGAQDALMPWANTIQACDTYAARR